MFQITQNITPKEIIEEIKNLRELKGREEETLNLIKKASELYVDELITLFWEEALTYQHMYMNNVGSKINLIKMEQAVYRAKFYIEKYKLKKWYSRLFRFLGRVSDYKKGYRKSVLYYKKAIVFIQHDPEPFRVLEIRSFLCSSLLLSGKTRLGLTLLKKLMLDFEKGEGRILKKNDYNTWAIWKSGLVIRVVEALIAKGVSFNKDLIVNMVIETEEELKNGDFGYRKEELNLLKKKLLKK